MEGVPLYLWSTFFVIHNILGFLSYMAWFALINVVKRFDPKLFWKLEGFMYQQINSINAFWLWGGGYTMYESGDDVSQLADQSCLLVGNHQNTCDVPSLLAWLATKSGVSSRVMWVMDVMFKFSHFGMVSNCHRDFFIESGQKARDESLRKFKSHLVEFYRPPLDRKWILLYPEGGFKYKQLEKSHRYARKNNLPLFEHVALPRIGAVKEILQNVGEKLTYLIDVTMAYDEEEKINFYRMFVPKRPFTVFLHTRVYLVSEVPTDEEGLMKWMVNLWSEKEQRMAYFKEHQTFPVLPGDEQKGVKSDCALVRDRRQVDLMNVSRFFTQMFFTTVPGAITLCVLCTLCLKLFSFIL